MVKSRFFIFAFIWIFSFNCVAWVNFQLDNSRVPEKMKSYSNLDQWAYQVITDICMSDNPKITAINLIFIDNQAQTREMIAGLNFDQMIARYQMRGLSPKLNSLLNSLGYYIGLADCFKDNTSQKNKLTITLIAADLFGDVSGAFQGVLIWITPVKFLSWLSRSYPMLAKTIGGGLGASGLAYGSHQLYKNLYLRKKSIENSEAMRKQIEDDYKSLSHLIQIETRPSELINLLALKKQLEEQIKDFDNR